MHLCSDFTIYDLLSCTSCDTHTTRLIDTVQPNKHYSGTLYGYVIKKPKTCENTTLFIESGYESDILFSTHYMFDLWLYNNGEIGAEITSSSTNVDAEWHRNIWLASGDVIVEFKTKIKIEDDQDHDVKLTNPAILTQNQTGVPFQVLYSSSDCDYSLHENTCVQMWQIRTYGASGIMDFSGIKPVQFDIEAHNVTKQKHIVWLNVTIVRGIDDIEATVSVDVDMELYKDEFFDTLITSETSIVNCHHVFGKVYINNGEYYPIRIDKVELCIFFDFDEGGSDLVPFDPLNPQETGCKTLGVNVVVFTLYVRGTNYYNDYFEFEFLDFNSSDVSSSFFKFKARAVTSGIQQLQVLWSSPYGSDHHSDHLIDMHETLSASIIDPISSHRLSGHGKHLGVLKSLPYPSKYYHAELLEKLGDDFSSFSSIIVDDDDDHGHKNYNSKSTTNSYHFSRNHVSVVCEDDEYYNDGDCHHYEYGNFTFLNFVLAILFLFFCFMFCLMFFWCYSKFDFCKGNTYYPDHDRYCAKMHYNCKNPHCGNSRKKMVHTPQNNFSPIIVSSSDKAHFNRRYYIE